METKLRVINEIDKHRAVHLRALSRIVNTGMPNIKRYIDAFEREGVITTVKDANLRKVMLQNHKRTITYLHSVHTERFLALPKNIQLALTDFLRELPEKPLIAMIFGSYANNTYTKTSDIDLFLVFAHGVKDFSMITQRVNMRLGVELSPIYVSYEEFTKNFFNSTHDFSHELRKKNIVLTGIEHYYELLWRIHDT
ncbi:MAG: nucleotidyltransferase domain-containing protein [Candidatus Woesearchaeota archaeon]|nr:nucleotidyltransferase domain-containing protein [Candidatus Woesearchaeota archaeon]